MLGDALALRRLIANLTDNAPAYGREALLSAGVEARYAHRHRRRQGLASFGAARDGVRAVRAPGVESRNRATGGAGLASPSLATRRRFTAAASP